MNISAGKSTWIPGPGKGQGHAGRHQNIPSFSKNTNHRHDWVILFTLKLEHLCPTKFVSVSVWLVSTI